MRVCVSANKSASLIREYYCHSELYITDKNTLVTDDTLVTGDMQKTLHEDTCRDTGHFVHKYICTE